MPASLPPCTEAPPINREAIGPNLCDRGADTSTRCLANTPGTGSHPPPYSYPSEPITFSSTCRGTTGQRHLHWDGRSSPELPYSRLNMSITSDTGDSEGKIQTKSSNPGMLGTLRLGGLDGVCWSSPDTATITYMPQFPFGN